MNNLQSLLKMKSQRINFVIEDENGNLSPLKEGQTGTIQSVDTKIVKAVLGEMEDIKLVNQLVSVLKTYYQKHKKPVKKAKAEKVN